MRSLLLIVFSLIVALAAVATVSRPNNVLTLEDIATGGSPGDSPTPTPQPAAWIARPDQDPAPEDIVASFKLAQGGMLLLVPVELKGKTVLFALDTGASSCIYDTSLTPLLGEPIALQEVRTSDGVVQAPLFESPDAKLGGLSLWTGSPVITSDLRPMREGLGEEVYGCIGMDFLAKHVFRVDPDRGEIVFLRSPGSDPGRRVPTTIENKIPYVQVSFSGLAEPQPFLVDTGCAPGGGTGLMMPATFDALCGRDKIKPIDTALAVSLSGQTLRRRGRVTESELAGHRHSDLIFSMSQRNVLGVGYWSRYVTTFDFAAGAIYLKKSGRFDQPDTHDLSGLSIVRRYGVTLVVAVEEGSPAALAGIRPADRILKATGNKVEDMPLSAVRRLLAVRGAKVPLLLQRGEEGREVSLLLPN
jgi:hypothetical protein